MSVIEQLKDSENFFLLAGPCVIEGEEMALRIAERVVKITTACIFLMCLKVRIEKPIVHAWIHLPVLVMKKL